MPTSVESPLALIEAGSKPAAPSAGSVLFYAKTDGKLYMQTPDGTETALGGGGTTVPTVMTAAQIFSLPTGQTLMSRKITGVVGSRIVGVAGAVLVGVN